MSALPKREHLRRLVELLPERELDTVEHLIEGLISLDRDRVSWTLEHAPSDDEPVTQEDVEAQAEARADIAAGRVYSHEEAKRMILVTTSGAHMS